MNFDGVELGFMNNSKYCEGCEYLNYDESEQNIQEKLTGEKPKHYCNKYDERLFHMDCEGRNHHPKILKCQKCVKRRK